MSSWCWEWITLAGRSPTKASLQEQLLAQEEAATAGRAAVQRLTNRLDALQRECGEVAGETQAAVLATRRAEWREREAAAELADAERTNERHREVLRELDKKLEAKNARIRVLEAIVNTIDTSD